MKFLKQQYWHCSFLLLAFAISVISFNAVGSIDPSGEWRSTCHPKQGHFATGTLIFRNSEVNEKWNYYSDADCKTLSMNVLIKLKYSLGQTVPHQPDVREIDDEMLSSSMVLQSKKVVEVFNQSAMCGYRDWEIGIAKDVTGNVACQIPAKGTKFYSLISLNGNKLYLGKTTSELPGTSPEKRPKEVDYNLSYSREVSAIAIADTSPQFGDIVRRLDGSIHYMNQYNAIKYCSNLGFHLPTVRELALLATGLGAQGIAELNQFPNQKVADKAGYGLVKAQNADGKIDSFYFNWRGYVRPTGDIGNNMFWSSSKSVIYFDDAFVLSGFYGYDVLYLQRRNYPLAVRCVVN